MNRRFRMKIQDDTSVKFGNEYALETRSRELNVHTTELKAIVDVEEILLDDIQRELNIHCLR